MLPVHSSKHIEMFTLLYFYTDTRFLLLQTVHLEYHQQRSSRSFILKMHQIDIFGKVDSQENHQNYCHQMSHFKAKMYQIRFRLGLRRRPRCGAYSAAPNHLAGFKGPMSKGRVEEREREGKRKDGKGRDVGERKEGGGFAS